MEFIDKDKLSKRTNMEKILQTSWYPLLEKEYLKIDTSALEDYNKNLNDYIYETIDTPVINPVTVVNTLTNGSNLTINKSPVSVTAAGSVQVTETPSAEIHYCKDCIYFESIKDTGYCNYHEIRLSEEDFCSFFKSPEDL